MKVKEMINEIYNKSVASSKIDSNKNPEYKKLDREYDNVLQELLSFVPEDKKGIWNKLENVIYQKEDINVKDAYHRGFKDGARLIMDIKE